MIECVDRLPGLHHSTLMVPSKISLPTECDDSLKTRNRYLRNCILVVLEPLLCLKLRVISLLPVFLRPISFAIGGFLLSLPGVFELYRRSQHQMNSTKAAAAACTRRFCSSHPWVRTTEKLPQYPRRRPLSVNRECLL